MKRYTKKYDEMIQAFASDFWFSKKGPEKLSELQRMIENNDKRLIDDIELLDELACKIRYGKVKIVEVISENYIEVDDA